MIAGKGMRSKQPKANADKNLRVSVSLAAATTLGIFLLGAAGCSRGVASSSPATATPSGSAANGAPASAASAKSAAIAAENSRKAAQAAMDQQRTELEQVPPPTKSHYLIVQTASAWQNPFIVVGTDKLKVEVMMGDANPLPGAGGLLRPAAARRNVIEIKTDDLGKMLSSLPVNAWPYGRVAAVEESQQTTRQDRIEMRRNMEATLQTLNSLGVVIHEWTEPPAR